MASQPSDRLKSILAEARGRAAASRGAGVPSGPTETHSVDSLMDGASSLPDPRALARLYRDRALVEAVPEDDASSLAPPDPPGQVRSPLTLSPAQVRRVVADLHHTFATSAYTTFETPVAPLEEIPLPAEEPLERETRDGFYVLGVLVALLIIAVFVLLAVNGPLRYHPPATPGPSPSVAAGR